MRAFSARVIGKGRYPYVALHRYVQGSTAERNATLPAEMRLAVAREIGMHPREALSEAEVGMINRYLLDLRHHHAQGAGRFFLDASSRGCHHEHDITQSGARRADKGVSSWIAGNTD